MDRQSSFYNPLKPERAKFAELYEFSAFDETVVNMPIGTFHCCCSTYSLYVVTYE